MLIRQKNQHLIPPDQILAKITIGKNLVLKEKIPLSGFEDPEVNTICTKEQPHSPLEKVVTCPHCKTRLKTNFKADAKMKGQCPKCSAPILIETKTLPWKAYGNPKYFVCMEKLLLHGAAKANRFIKEGGSQYAEPYGVSHVEIEEEFVSTANGQIEGEFHGTFTINEQHKIKATVVFEDCTVHVEDMQWITTIPGNNQQKHQIECAIAGFVALGKCYKFPAVKESCPLT